MKDTSGKSGELVIRAGAAQDATGLRFRPARLHLRGDRLERVEAEPANGAEDGLDSGIPCLDLPDCLILPGFVNAHAHLDLTAIGPVAYGSDFTGWIGEVRRARPVSDEAIRDSTRLGIDLSLKGGTAIIGDIAGAGSFVPGETIVDSGSLQGISFIEIFGIGAARKAALENLGRLADRIREKNRASASAPKFRLGLQPHAPYSAAPEVFERCSALAAEHALPLCTHLAETEEEIEFTRNGTGPLAGFLHSLGLWDDSIAATGQDPIESLEGVLSANPWLLAHVNYATTENLRLLGEVGASIVYCPRASEYFRHRGHRYREMLEIGINVCLGTDSILCLDTPRRISIWDEMQLLFERDGTDPLRLLEMATINGARALGFDPTLVMLSFGSPARVNAVRFDPNDPADPLEQALRSKDAGFTPIEF